MSEEVTKPVDGTTTVENTEQKKKKQLFESATTSGMGGGSEDDTDTTDTTKKNVDAFYQVLWPVLEKEGGWTMVGLPLLFDVYYLRFVIFVC